MSRTSMVGIIANPASARDIRRLVADGAAVSTNAKINILKRVLAGLGGVGVHRVLSMTDLSGISGGLHALADKPSAKGWPILEVVEEQLSQSSADTVRATGAMAAASGDIPLVSISTGTNNVFPRQVEPTVAGIAAGLVATGRVERDAATDRAKNLLVEHRGQVERALVDVAIIDTDHVGAGAVWDASAISELFLRFAEPDAIGLSAIGGHLQPVGRTEPKGLVLHLGQPAAATPRVPIVPGLVADVGVVSIDPLEPGDRTKVRASSGVVAIDGERMFRFGPGNAPTVTLRADGPIVIDVVATLEHAARAGVLARRDLRCG